MASILLQFPPPPQQNHLTVLEQEGQLKDISQSVSFPSLPEYPEVNLQTGTVPNKAAQCDSAQLAFLSHGQTTWKRALHSWYRGGLMSTLEEIIDSKDEVPGWLVFSSQRILMCLQKIGSLKDSFFPQMGMSNTDMLQKYSHVCNWQKSPVQALAWHPHVTKLALALRDDSVHIYYSGSSLCPVLKHKLQKQVADLAWQPLSSSVLAVACQNCVLIWHVEPTSLAVRPSSSTVQVLQSPGHSPVTSLSWSPDSSHLVSASPRKTYILVWDVPRETCVTLKRDRGGGVALLRYSPDGSKLFTGTTSSLFRVWGTEHWNCEVWSHLTGRCTAACWSPDGTVLVFAMEGESAIYAIRYGGGDHSEHNTSSVATSVMLADVSQIRLSVGMEDEIQVGGQVQSIAWDDSGERVAVMFKNHEMGSNSLVAVFKATIHPVLELLPNGFVKGKSGENAHHIAFQPNVSKGALLSVVWSTGRVAYIPMHFVQTHEIRHTQAFRLDPMSPFASHRERF